MSRYKKTDKADNDKHLETTHFQNVPPSNNDIWIIAKKYERLDLLAHRYYGKRELWWIIAIANKDIIRRDSYALKPGLEIRIPINIEDIIEDFEKINKDSTGYGYN